MTRSSSELEIVATRLIDAPRERVFAAFADAARLARWWGPKGFTNTFDEFELRPLPAQLTPGRKLVGWRSLIPGFSPSPQWRKCSQRFPGLFWQRTDAYP
jgi:uncharacterized protein YndB with AHSA1/START domain